MTETRPAPLTESVARFEQSGAYLLEALPGLTYDHLTRPTPCADWNLRALLQHVADAADGLAGLVTTGVLRFPAPPRTDAADPAADAHDRVRRLLDVVASVSQRVALADEQRRWATTATHAGAIELAAHAWDIYTAVGQHRPIPAELATELLALATSLIDDDREPRFGPVVSDLLPTAAPSDRFIAFLGRHPGAMT